jgi:hypothetical protein
LEVYLISKLVQLTRGKVGLERAENYVLAPIGRRLHGATHPPGSAREFTTTEELLTLKFRGVTNSMKA